MCLSLAARSVRKHLVRCRRTHNSPNQVLTHAARAAAKQLPLVLSHVVTSGVVSRCVSRCDPFSRGGRLGGLPLRGSRA